MQYRIYGTPKPKQRTATTRRQSTMQTATNKVVKKRK